MEFDQGDDVLWKFYHYCARIAIPSLRARRQGVASHGLSPGRHSGILGL
jgi:hypothetical protein